MTMYDITESDEHKFRFKSASQFAGSQELFRTCDSPKFSNATFFYLYETLVDFGTHQFFVRFSITLQNLQGQDLVIHQSDDFLCHQLCWTVLTAEVHRLHHTNLGLWCLHVL